MRGRKANVYFLGALAGTFEETQKNKQYRFAYASSYSGPPISLTMPAEKKEYVFKEFPPFFDGLLPEGAMLEGLLRRKKIDRHDLFSQLMAVGHEMVGAVTVEKII